MDLIQSLNTLLLFLGRQLWFAWNDGQVSVEHCILFRKIQLKSGVGFDKYYLLKPQEISFVWLRHMLQRYAVVTQKPMLDSR